MVSRLFLDPRGRQPLGCGTPCFNFSSFSLFPLSWERIGRMASGRKPRSAEDDPGRCINKLSSSWTWLSSVFSPGDKLSRLILETFALFDADCVADAVQLFPPAFWSWWTGGVEVAPAAEQRVQRQVSESTSVGRSS